MACKKRWYVMGSVFLFTALSSHSLVPRLRPAFCHLHVRKTGQGLGTIHASFHDYTHIDMCSRYTDSTLEVDSRKKYETVTYIM